MPGLQLLAPALALSSIALLFRALERRAPAVPGQVRPPGSIRTDLAHLLISPVLARAVMVAAVALGLVAAALLTGERWTVEALLDARTQRAWVGSWPLPLQLLGLVVLSDLLGYWIHRWFHHSAELWRFHAIHHSSRALDALASVRNHPLSAGLNRLLHLLPIVLLGFDPRLVAGVAPFLLLYGVLLHANVRWRFGPLRFVLASPAFHRWHHASFDSGLDRPVNLAGLLPIWDLLFGTYHLPAGEPARCGVDQDPPPDRFWEQMRAPLVQAPTPSRLQ